MSSFNPGLRIFHTNHADAAAANVKSSTTDITAFDRTSEALLRSRSHVRSKIDVRSKDWSQKTWFNAKLMSKLFDAACVALECNLAAWLESTK